MPVLSSVDSEIRVLPVGVGHRRVDEHLQAIPDASFLAWVVLSDAANELGPFLHVLPDGFAVSRQVVPKLLLRFG